MGKILAVIFILVVSLTLEIFQVDSVAETEPPTQQSTETSAFYPGQLVLGFYPGFVYPETEPILDDIQKAADEKWGTDNEVLQLIL